MHAMSKSTKKFDKKGFTIIELMIATSAFSIVLLVCLGALVYVGRLYYKGITLTQTQAATRDAVDSIADAVKFSREVVEPSDSNIPYDDEPDDKGWNGHVCVGSRKYSYQLGKVLVNGTPAPGSNQTNQALVESVDPACDTGSPNNIPVDSNDLFPPREILGEFMRLNEFTVTPPDALSGLVTVSISIVYGGDGNKKNDSELFNYVSGDSDTIESCKTGVAGAQFCAVSNLSKTVKGVSRL